LKAANAVFGVSYGLEFPRYFALPANLLSNSQLTPLERFSSGAEECHAHAAPSAFSISPRSRSMKSRAAGCDSLDKLLAGRLPASDAFADADACALGRLMGI